MEARCCRRTEISVSLYRVGMADIVLRVRFIGGDFIDVRFDDPDTAESDALIERAVTLLADNSGMLRCSHGDRLMVIYGRGVAGLEVAPRGAVL